jgi:hypothetical protein
MPEEIMKNILSRPEIANLLEIGRVKVLQGY